MDPSYMTQSFVSSKRWLGGGVRSLGMVRAQKWVMPPPTSPVRSWGQQWWHLPAGYLTVSGSDIAQQPHYPDEVICVFLSSSWKVLLLPQMTPWPLLFVFFSTQYSIIILRFEATMAQLLRASLTKPSSKWGQLPTEDVRIGFVCWDYRFIIKCSVEARFIHWTHNGEDVYCLMPSCFISETNGINSTKFSIGELQWNLYGESDLLL